MPGGSLALGARFASEPDTRDYAYAQCWCASLNAYWDAFTGQGVNSPSSAKVVTSGVAHQRGKHAFYRQHHAGRGNNRQPRLA
jgi:hypothetical protein